MVSCGGGGGGYTPTDPNDDNSSSALTNFSLVARLPKKGCFNNKAILAVTNLSMIF